MSNPAYPVFLSCPVSCEELKFFWDLPIVRCVRTKNGEETTMRYSPGGYSWLCVTKEPEWQPKESLTEIEHERLEKDCEEMESLSILLRKKTAAYHDLFHQYDPFVGTPKGEKLLLEMEELRKEIKMLSQTLSDALDQTMDLTHLGEE
ncbi:MAG: hypothetical protein K940chlam9_01573 [Chlamydiae bacterium]|nr:hypothetical protein [Chlamydiota bacterium]